MHTATVNQTLVVLTPRLSEKLADVIDAQRELRAQGFRVVEQQLHPGTTQRPLLELDHGTEALREQLAKIVLKREGQRRRVTGRFQDVDVSYVEVIS